VKKVAAAICFRADWMGNSGGFAAFGGDPLVVGAYANKGRMGGSGYELIGNRRWISLTGTSISGAT